MSCYLRQYAMTDWVTLTGRLDRRQVRAVLADADVFVAPARRESFGLAALEARLSGVPVVAYADSGIASFVVPEKEGLLAASPAELVAAIVKLARDAHVPGVGGPAQPRERAGPLLLAGGSRRFRRELRSGHGADAGGAAQVTVTLAQSPGERGTPGDPAERRPRLPCQRSRPSTV